MVLNNWVTTSNASEIEIISKKKFWNFQILKCDMCIK